MGGFDIKISWIPLVVAFSLLVLLGPLFIPILRRLRVGQNILQEGPQRHHQKAGTPTMGGVLIILVFIITVLFFSGYLWFYRGQVLAMGDLSFLMFAILSYGLLGLADDYIKIARHRNLGLTVLQKIIGQLFIGLILFIVLLEVRSGGSGQPIYRLPAIPPILSEPVDLNFSYLILLLPAIIGTANATNLTDGLDGLLSGTAACSYGAYAVIGAIDHNPTVVILSLAMVGALLGFLVFNTHPAKIFMGDTGSMAVGAGIAALAVITRTELSSLLIIGGVFIAEALSVLVQVVSFRFRGKRVFRMAPLHHHFELVGWSEWRVVVTFWIISFLLAVLGVLVKVF
ncbi:phospho-N-acetylmuramoyl-pentapeptide-transferase [Pasteuria penetrans]|uniref:phospho-N-acetylmuramoyl-pentapeptide- transferase n=1 Tax=Pasteuria penetrans TaxID=86005 RepID=UPI0011EFD2B3|nr:phospho-N-acetylmuramoyl-pentapeptide-transferase [Pasteuria penetrans]